MQVYKLTPKQIKTRILVLVPLILLLIVAIFENYNLGVTYYSYSSSKLSSAFSGFRIVQISDFHNANFGPKADTVIAKTRELNPDIIVITGDIIDSRNTNMDEAIDLVRGLTDIAPTYYVNGNHECRFDNDVINTFYNDLSEAGVNVILGEAEVYSIIDGDESQSINIVGLEENSIDELPSLINEESFNLVLAHEPQYISDYSQGGSDLVFCGHAHGGQFRIPFTNIGLISPGEGFFPKYTSGPYEENDTTMFVSRGIGNSAVPLRIFNNPEIVVVDIV